jgi:hypothetical protein
MRDTTMTATPLERAIGLTIQDLANSLDLTLKEIQAKTGLADKTFRRYFTECTRHIPLEELELVAQALGTTVSDIAGLAEERLRRSGK